VHSYYHLVPLVYSYCSVGYLSDSIDYSSSSWLECFTDVGAFLVQVFWHVVLRWDEINNELHDIIVALIQEFIL
jgi:hypothetical protein